jgi:hypothetical protein
MDSMNTLLLVVFITTLAGSVTLAATERTQKADIPSDLLTTLQSDLKEDLAETKSCLEREGLTWNESLNAEPLDLDRTRHALLVQGIGRCLAGNANSPIFLYIRGGNGWRRLLYNIGQSLQICTQAYPPCPAVKGPKRKSAIKRGWPDLAIWRHGSAGRRSIGVSV